MNQDKVCSSRSDNVKLELNSRFECPICLEYLKNPVLTSCGHKFCSECIDFWINIKQKNYCPIDEEALTKENIFIDNYTKREILATNVKCLYCSSQISIPDYEAHVHQCKIKRKSLLPVTDENTHNFTPKNNLKLTIFSPEDSMQVGQNVQETYRCKFYGFGCKEIFKTEALLERHYEIKTSFHLDLLCTLYYKEMNMKSNKIDTNGQGFSRCNEASRSGSDIQGKQLVRQKGVNTHNAENADAVITPPFERNQKEIESYLMKNKDEESKLWEPTKQSPEEVNNNLMRLMYERTVLLEQSKLELEIELNKLKQNEENLMLRLCNGVYVWRLEQFREKLTEMRHQNKYFYSSSFYSSIYGYRFCTRLNISREDSNYLSLFIHLVQGENDDILPWPFIGKIIFTAINTVHEKCVIDEIQSNRNLDSFKRPLNYFLNKKAFGFNNFIRISDVLAEDSSFLDENDIFVIKTQIIEGSSS